MSKRFTSTEKWADPWFRKLSPKLKCLWDWLYTQCDIVGSVDPDFELASFQIGDEVSERDLKDFGNRIRRLPSGRYWIVKFIEFQYGELTPDCRAHRPILSLCDRLSIPYQENANTLSIPYRENANRVSIPYQKNANGYQYPQEKEKEQEQEKEKEKEQEKEQETNDSTVSGQEVTPEFRACSETLKARILERRQQKITDETLRKWDNDVRLMIERDNRTAVEIMRLINECHDMEPKGASGFTWRDNILSMGALRQRWNEGKIYIGMTTAAIVPESEVRHQIEERQRLKRERGEFGKHAAGASGIDEPGPGRLFAPS